MNAGRRQLAAIPAVLGALCMLMAACSMPLFAERTQRAGACELHSFDRLFFALDAAGDPHAEERWTHFIENEVTPRFPDGLTVLHGSGQWRNRAGMIEREPARVVEIVHPAQRDAERKLDEIVAIYKERFRQESVLRLSSAVRACS